MGSNSQHWDWERGMEILSLLARGAAELYEMGQCEENVEEAVRKGIECAGRGDHRKALEYYEEALTISQEKGFTRHETNIYAQIGYSSFHVGDYERSINFMKKFLNDGGEDLNGVVNSILGSCYQHNGQYKEAIPYHEKSWKIASQLGNNENYGVAREICNLGFAYKGLGKHEMARRNFSESLRISKDSMYKDIEQQVHMGIGCIHKELGDYERAIGCFQQSLELAEQLVDRKGIALVYERLGGVNFAQNRYKRAIEYFEKCLDKARRIDDRVLIALAYKNMGRVHQKLNELQEAISCYQEYLKRADEKRDRSEIAEVNILHLGVCYVQCKEYEKGVECYLKGLEMVKQLEDKEKEGNVHENLGDAYANLSKYNDAQKHYTRAQVIANLDAEGGKKLKGRVCLKLGDVFRVQEKISMAISCYNEALENAERSRDLESEVGALERLGNAFHSNGNYDSAIEYHEKSLDLAIKLNDKKREQRTRENLGDVCASCKKWSKANKWYNSSRALANELNNAEAVYNCERKMGNTYYENQDYDNAIFYHQRCLKIAEEKNEKAGILESSRVLGDSYRKVNQPEKSLQFYKYFIEMVGTQTSNLERATVYLKIGKLYAEIGDSDNAIDSCFKCLNLAVDSGDFKLKEEVLEILADEYYNRYQFDKAYKYYLEDLDIAGRDKRCQIYYKLGNTVSAQHRIAEAIQFYEKALELSQSLADPNVDLEADIREALAGALFSNTDYEDAIKHHSENLEFAKSLADEKRQQSEYENLANSYSAKEQWLLAIENYCHSGVVAKRLHDKEAVQRCEKLMKEQAFALECLCNDHILNGDYRKALDMQEKYVELARKIGDRVQEGNANCNIAEVHLARCQYEEAVRFTRKALGISDNDSGKARANDILGCAHAALGKFIEAERFLLEEISIVEILDDKSGIARAKGNIGVALLGKDDQREAVACFRKELKLAEEIGNKKEEGRANENFGRYYAAIGKCNEAIEYYQKFMRIAEEIGDKAGIGRAKGAIGTMLTEMGQYQKAVKYHEEERIITNELGNEVRKGQMLGNLGNAYKGLCDYENAIALQKTSLQIAEDNYVECDERRAYETLGNTYLASGQCRKALEYQNIALKLSQQLGHKAAEGRIHQSMAKSYYLSGQIEKALNSGKKALAIAEKVGDKAGEGRASGTNWECIHGVRTEYARSEIKIS
ncbi:tetratricopeptide repeat protein 28-like [Dendronephthya gigantea]|uniref:tetratricopeptide repeat protein 28-like n=1 Tax=Dendronephthya gigantea TaxID=151771 RepID=UPI00106C8965|nr:tetratricopeptide repeat protein 28-like [Dendronephthya gigantea]